MFSPILKLVALLGAVKSMVDLMCFSGIITNEYEECQLNLAIVTNQISYPSREVKSFPELRYGKL
jgi:hypothetical protein